MDSRRIFPVILVILLAFTSVLAKVYTRCELAEELHNKYKLPMNQIPYWVCIAERTSRLNTKQPNHLAGYGIFGIGNKFWCSLNNEKKECNVKCSALEDDNLSDDVNCIKTIYSKTKLIRGDGFTAWDAYNNHCKNDKNIQNYVKGCHFATKDSKELDWNHLDLIPDVRMGDE